MRWYKGNTHTHTLNSDGDSTPDDVVRWYREHGYQFLVLTDHNFLTSVDGLNALHGADEQFLVIRGEEVTSQAGDKPVHVNGLDVERLVEPPTGSSVGDVLQRAVDGIRSASGVPHINHPNFGWAMTGQDLQQVRTTGSSRSSTGTRRSTRRAAAACRDSKRCGIGSSRAARCSTGSRWTTPTYFKQPGNPRVAGPGRGWVMVRAARLEADALLEALESGNFYASTGVVLDDVEATSTALTVTGEDRGHLEVPHPLHRSRRTGVARGE